MGLILESKAGHRKDWGQERNDHSRSVIKSSVPVILVGSERVPRVKLTAGGPSYKHLSLLLRTECRFCSGRSLWCPRSPKKEPGSVSKTEISEQKVVRPGKEMQAGRLDSEDQQPL